MTMAWIEAVNDFIAQGGPVVKLILVAAVLLWTLVTERYLFFLWVYPRLRRQWLQRWNQRRDKHSWYALKIRERLISEARLQLRRTLPLIKILVSLSPLLGLFGTVNGMIHMFDALAVFGTGNARAMATHISQATLPTLAGMTQAIAGLYASQRIERRVEAATRHLSDQLHFE
ncbi:biopolymer transport protein ExbB [Methylomarinovum tepidoasis]|uniref:Biopolymer transport protein ExbB n=1 Tax=Methylomarinovum tepidoasis TaxID=2840183 RepID=A0AAU9CTM6_9GAMM|nr:MotA/TolQ/ExbB proton channel family protein [Methylomarinovum sp. IN45]BCX89778.1 biopolymer transport protein ExbB [Methylomarinovum sp. IN45]